MKEKIILAIWISILSLGIYWFANNARSQMYDYNGGILKTVYAAVNTDTNNAYTENPEWSKDVSNILIKVSKWNVSDTTINEDTLPPPVINPIRHSH